MRDDVREATRASGGEAGKEKQQEAAPAPAPMAARPAGGMSAADAQSAELSMLGEGDGGGAGAPGGPGAPTDLGALRAQSTGVALDPALAESYGARFGADFGDVMLHFDAAADAAAGATGAQAFVVDRDIYFAADEYAPGTPAGDKLLARELAHIAQGAGRAAGGDAAVSAPDSAAERESASAGDRVAAGGTARVGSAPADQIHREPVDELDQALEGNWLGSVDGATVVTRFLALPEAQRISLVTDEAHRDRMRRVMTSLNGLQVTQIYAGVPRGTAFDLRWKIYWLIRGGQIGSLSLAQWRWIAVYNSPADWASLRAYADGYRAFLVNCPAELVPPWDVLKGLQQGMTAPTAVAVRNAINNLSPAQGRALLADGAMLRAVLTAAGTAAETYRALSYMGANITQTVRELDALGRLSGLGPGEWGTLMGEAPRADVDALAADATLWPKVEAACPPGILQAARGATQQVDDGTGLGTTEANINNQLDDPVQLGALIRTMGAAGFLGLTCAAGADVAGNYGKVKTAGKVGEVVTGLLPGQQMSATTQANLKQWFLAETGDVALSQQMTGKRFNVTVGGTGAYDHTAGGTSGTTPGNWTIPALVRVWTVLERLPPQNVEQNTRLVHMLRDTSGSDGGAYYGYLLNDPNYQSGDVMMGYTNVNANRTDAGFGPGVYSAGGRGAGSAAVPMNVFNATLRHEIGHAVDRQLGIMDTWGSQDVAGNWVKYGSYAEMVDAIITAGGGLGTTASPRHGYPAADVGVYRQAMIQALTQTQSFTAALQAIKPAAAAPPDAGPVAAVFQTNRWTGGGAGPWYNPGNWKPQNDRAFQRAYGDAGSLYSFKDSVRQARGVTQYQWRAPGEWFAEVYQVYYAEQETAPDAPVGGILRSKDPQAAEMMSTIVDRGYSPQDMGGGSTAPAPGTP
ncbi:MAG: DUF4157 domain-containing protein [Myxococcales bacterium]|nr:DUF4157 domain-containing protein [Myxococcales bacterium]